MQTRIPPLLLRSSLLLGGLLGASALAQAFGFAPTVIELDSQRSLNTQTTLYNTGNTPAKFSVQVKAWRQEGSQNVLDDTRDLIVNPTTFTIPAGGQQVIRLGLKKKPGADELTYRLVVRQEDLAGSMPQQQVQIQGQNVAINMALQFSLPIYAAPPAAAARVQYAATDTGQDIALKISNAGNRHETYNGLVATRGGKSVQVSSFAVLRGSAYTATLAGLGSGGLSGAGGPLTLTFTNAKGVNVSETIGFQ